MSEQNYLDELLTPEEETKQRRAVVSEALSWISTPYADMGEVKGPHGGVDCATLLKCVFRNAGIVQDFQVGTYSPQRFLHQSEEHYLEFVESYAREIDEGSAKPGDIVLYRIGKAYAHGAIIVDPGWPHIIHAYYAAHAVVRGIGNQGSLGRPVRKAKFFSRW